MATQIAFPEMVKHFRLKNNLTMEELAKKIGKAKSSISKWESGERSPKIYEIEEIAEFFGVEPNIMMFGFGKVKSTSTTKQILDNVFSKLENKRQEKVVTYAKSELREQNKENIIELFSYNVHEKLSAGTGYGYFDDGNSDVVYFDKEYDYDFASWIFGDSMTPDYPNGDVALIKEGPFEYSGEVYAVDWDGQSYIKKVYQEKDGLRLVSTNEKYSDKFAPFSEEPRIIGKVVANFTPLEK